MLDVGFSEVLVIFVLALVVLGPEKLPRVASQVGRLVGRARAMARQFKEQLEEEVNLEEVRKAHAANPPTTPVVPAPEAQPLVVAEPSPVDPLVPDPVDFRADTFSHAHATDEHGANPFHPSGAASEPPAPEVTANGTAAAEVPAGMPAGTPAAGMPATPTPPADSAPRSEGTDAQASMTTAPPAPPVSATTGSHERGS
ncbi:MAG: preprotein translocase subunit TatB [Gammaproteobacteria bacterium]|nr:preprotein translocase subunit TatB [Gammaproteobacteria bacterium]